MNLSKYDGNIHPDEWIDDIQTHFDIIEIISEFLLEIFDSKI
ncbi:225_t:CDS:2 [Funneliformis caledonium]|uniref:225_t:CDS:1 n=1 Tax=Funneliformis caledonium TaxID=1117310 RepID=A0A9N9GQ31_9GLOM|nr:225_t:CDS:2 [Funneliformis caledonium]